MDDAFERLSQIQKSNINKQMFGFAYKCVATSGYNSPIHEIVLQATKDCPHLAPDLMRYCRLVSSIK